ncbi:MAG: tRNA pseudouridine(13) synthase TruD [Longimicrobiales bacterium]
MSIADLPYLTADQPGLRAVFKARWEDFQVEEIPEIEPEGSGDHLWLEIEKWGLATPRAVSEVARALGVKPSSVGYAGMKDARAVARQWVSVEHVEPERALSLANPRIRVLQAVRHFRKLRRGWHSGNRFVIRLRPGSGAAFESMARSARLGDEPGGAASPAASSPPLDFGLGDWGMADGAVDPLGHVRGVLDTLSSRGVPNYYGPQRFGTRGDTWRVGRALAREEWDEAAGLIAGRPLYPGGDAVDPAAGIFPDSGDILRARELFDQGRYTEAAETWPRGFGQCARLAEAMERTGGDAARALPVVGKRMLRLYASAYQSWLFNAVLAERIRDETMATLLEGDLAWKHDTEALFPVEDPAAEQPRADAFEVSPTGPLVGRRMREPEGAVAKLEARVIEEAGLRPEALESRAMKPLTGRRRPLRFALGEVGVDAGSDDRGPYLELRFALPPGCYATAVLRELGKGGIEEAASG